MFPLRLPAPFCEDVGDAALLQVAQDAFHHAHPVGQHKRQPMAITRLTVSEGEAAECSARSRGRGRCPEHGGDVRSLVGMQDLDGERLLLRTLPAISRLFAVVAML